MITVNSLFSLFFSFEFNFFHNFTFLNDKLLIAYYCQGML